MIKISFHPFLITAKCAFEDFLCHHGHVCIKQSEVCDVHPHCLDGSDESVCGRYFQLN